jgi:hypothetical protein
MQLPDLEHLHPWLTPELARRGLHEDWLEVLVVNSIIAHLTDQIPEPTPDAELLQERDRLLATYNLRSTDHFTYWCRLRGFDDDMVTSYLSRSWRWRQWVEGGFGGKIESVYLLRQDSYTSYIMSILQVVDQGLARELFLRIQEGSASFDSLARRYSIGREASSGGVLGPALAANIRPALLAALKSMQPGDLKEPFLMDDHWVILRLDERRTPLLDDTMRRILLEDHSRRWLIDQARELIASFLRKQSV